MNRRGGVLAIRCFPSEEEEEMVGHLLIHCSKARLLSNLFSALVGFNWVCPLTVWETLRSWHESFVVWKQKKVWLAASLVSFGLYSVKGQNCVWKCEEMLADRMKIYFLVICGPLPNCIQMICLNSLLCSINEIVLN